MRRARRSTNTSTSSLFSRSDAEQLPGACFGSALVRLMDEAADLLRKQAQEKMKNWRGKGPDIYYYQPRLTIDDEPWWIATFMHSTKHTLDINETTRIVQRAVEIWRSRGSAERFLYTNRVTRGLSDCATSC